MRRLTLKCLLLIVVLALAGPRIVQASKFVPFKGRETGVQVVTISGGLLTIRFTTSGKATHLGNYQGTGVVVIDLGTGQTISANAVLTAANGDKIFVSLVGQPENAFVTKIRGTITGGTGRFANARGFYNYVLTTKLPAGAPVNPFVGVWRGAITSPGWK